LKIGYYRAIKGGCMKRSLGAATLVVPSPVWVIGTYDSAGIPNLMTAAWAGIVCSKPPAVSVSLREATYTYANIVDRKAFTVNVPSADQTEIADFLGMASGRDTDKVGRAGLTTTRSDLVDAPLVAEFALSLECRLLQAVRLGLHTVFVGEIIDVKADERILVNDLPAMELANPVLFSAGEQAYYGVGERIGPAFHLGRRLLGRD
jgi:flavin reductase (DIM6/NTAB) family NADH-FMN oxidoreductase RutF